MPSIDQTSVRACVRACVRAWCVYNLPTASVLLTFVSTSRLTSQLTTKQTEPSFQPFWNYSWLVINHDLWLEGPHIHTSLVCQSSHLFTEWFPGKGSSTSQLFCQPLWGGWDCLCRSVPVSDRLLPAWRLSLGLSVGLQKPVWAWWHKPCCKANAHDAGTVATAGTKKALLTEEVFLGQVLRTQHWEREEKRDVRKFINESTVKHHSDTSVGVCFCSSQHFFIFPDVLQTVVFHNRNIRWVW